LSAPTRQVPAGEGTGRWLSRPMAWLMGLTLAGWSICAMWPRVLITLGISDYGRPYLDSYAVLAALDAVRAGHDPHGMNPFDALRRPHVYSDWWLALRWLGLGREHNFLVGTAWVGAFALAAWGTLKPRRVGEAIWLAALLVSPSVLLVINRGNNDLVIFVLLAGCALVTFPAWWGGVAAVACLGLATGLKYFPAPAALAFLWVRPVRRAPAWVLGGLLAVGGALASVWPEIARSRFTIASGIYTMGAPIWWRDIGWKDGQAALPGLLLIAGAAVILSVTRMTRGLAERGGPRERLLAAAGAIVVLTCFLAGVNYAYRWIFILWPAGWLGRQALDAALPTRERAAAWVGCALVLLCLWMDGLLAAAVNLFFAQYAATWQEHLDIVWRKCTQPLHWILMMLLAGWLCEGVVATAQEWWRCRRDP
jgi:hypothetical protein